MSCERYREALTAQAGGGPASGELESHLAACADCRYELRALQEALALADAALGGLAVAEPSPEFRARLRQRVAEQRGGAADHGLGWRWPWLATAVTIAAAVVVATLLHGWAPPGRQVSSLATPAPVRTTTMRPSPAVDRDPVAPAGSSQHPVARAAVSRTHVERPSARRASRPQPEVLVPAGQADALAEFAEALRREPVERGSLLLADLRQPLAEPGEVEIAPIEIAPLRAAGQAGS